MTLAEAIPLFLDYAGHNDSTYQTQLRSAIHSQTLFLFSEYFSSDRALTEISTEILRDFLSRWYVEKVGVSKPANSRSAEPDEHSTFNPPALKQQSAVQVPEASALLASMEEFLRWAGRQANTDQAVDYTPILSELSRSLPRAQEITSALSRFIREHAGAFAFPEFLTSFEEGGASEYDIDAPGKVGAIDGYFRIIRTEGSMVEADELISEARIWPIVFPADVAALLNDSYIINLEVVRKPDGWQIAGCGFAYPPGTIFE